MTAADRALWRNRIEALFAIVLTLLPFLLGFAFGVLACALVVSF